MTKSKITSIIFALLLTAQMGFAQQTETAEPAENKSVASCATTVVDEVVPEGTIDTSKLPVSSAFYLEDTSKIIKNPGNCPIELLRRIGRALEKVWPKDKSSFLSALFIIEEKIGTPRPAILLTEEKLTKDQQTKAQSLIDSFKSDYAELAKTFPVSSESISIKIASDISTLLQHYKNLTNLQTASGTLNGVKIADLQQNAIPILESIEKSYGMTSISENGMFARFKLILRDDCLKKLFGRDKITIGQYIDDEPLIAMAQAHKLENIPELAATFDASPVALQIKNMLASSGLDLEKDILSNYAQESVIYLNLPLDKNNLPDLRFVAYLPKIENLTAILPKLSKFCVNMGIFVNNVETDVEGIAVTKLAYCMYPQIGFYTGIVGNFCVIATSKDGAVKAMKHIKDVAANATSKINDYSFYGRIRSKDLNVQLQQLLQSPAMQKQNIPPIPNLTFLEQLGELECHCEIETENLNLNFDLPFLKTEK